ncbi:MAG: RpiB/LacA/LacB family sugar-phosphate isomerase [Planctomycetota bacterium]
MTAPGEDSGSAGDAALRAAAARAAARARAATDTKSDFGRAESSEERELVAESLVRAAPPDSELVIPPHARVTPLARELAFQRSVRLVTGRSAEPLGPVGAAARRAARIAVASDHGGLALKDQLVPLLREMGERPVDHGPTAADGSVDYPDFARKVALEVSEGRADLGIVIDGAGIGSAMVANKVPGILAANAWDAAAARNAREHNHANVLTLGAGRLDLAGARAIVAAFLETPVGDGRHARRAAKARAVEAEFQRSRHLARTFDEGRG